MNDEPRTLPPRFLDRLRAVVGAGRFAAVAATFAAPQRVAFRLNPLRADPAATLAALRAGGLDPAPVGWYPHAFTLPPEARAALLATDAVATGAAYLQNLSSMVPPLVLGAEPGERVLDLAAAPGSKTLQLAALAGPTAEIAAVEVVRDRFFRLRANLAAGGAGFVRTYLQDGTRVDRYRPGHFDRVLLDAPCSTEGRFRADDPETFRYWSVRKVHEARRRQTALLAAGLGALREGGVLVYSTCSLAPEENEGVLDAALTASGGAVVLEPLGLDVPAAEPALAGWDDPKDGPTAFAHDLANARRIVPDGTFEAFFVARLRKVGPTAPPADDRRRDDRRDGGRGDGGRRGDDRRGGRAGSRAGGRRSR